MMTMGSLMSVAVVSDTTVDTDSIGIYTTLAAIAGKIAVARRIRTHRRHWRRIRVRRRVRNGCSTRVVS